MDIRSRWALSPLLGLDTRQVQKTQAGEGRMGRSRRPSPPMFEASRGRIPGRAAPDTLPGRAAGFVRPAPDLGRGASRPLRAHAEDCRSAKRRSWARKPPRQCPQAGTAHDRCATRPPRRTTQICPPRDGTARLCARMRGPSVPSPKESDPARGRNREILAPRFKNIGSTGQLLGLRLTGG